MPDSLSTNGTVPDSAAVTEELERLASSNCFRRAERCLRLLRHVITVTLEGRSGELKEYVLGTTVLNRPESFDPRIDSVVRLEVRRLRLKLSEYYQTEGLHDPVVIDLPKGAYVPEFRFRVVPEVAAAIRPPAPAIPAHRAVYVWLSIGLILVLIVAFSWYRVRKSSPGLPVRASIAVLGFRNLSAQQEASWISAALSELMNIDLGADQRLRALPLENVSRMRSELSLTAQAVYPPELLQRIRTNLGSDYVVSGSYLERGQQIHVDAILFDVRSGQQVAAIQDDSQEDTIPELAERCSMRFRAELGVRLSGAERPSLASRGTEQYALGMEQYARGMEALRKGDALNARVYLEKAIEKAPFNPRFHSGLAATLSALGLDIQAAQEAKRALDSSAGLERVEQLDIEGRYRSMAHDWPRAIQVYQALFTLLPDDLEYGLLLASVELHGGQAQGALGTVNALRKLPAPLGDDPRIDLAEAQAAGALSDFGHTQIAAKSAAEKAKDRGARLLYAKARLLQSGAMQNLNMAGFQEVRAEARRICMELGDRFCVAAAYRIEANQMAGMGELAVAQRLYQTVLEIANQLGNALEELNATTGLANAARLKGDLRAAEGYYRSALAIASPLGPQKSAPISLGLAETLAESGRISEARGLIEQALRTAEQIGDRESAGVGEAALANTLALEGKGAAAIGEYNRAISVLREVKEPLELSETLLAAGNAQLDEADLAGARKSFEESRTVALSFSGESGLPETQLAFARLNFAEGDFASAASHARLALSAFTASGREGDRYQAAAVLAVALMRRGNISEASTLLAQFPIPDAARLPARSVVQFEVARSQVLASAGQRSEAMRGIDAVIADTAHWGIPKLERDALKGKQALKEIALSRGVQH